MYIEYDKLSENQQSEIYRRYQNIIDKEISKEFDDRHESLIKELNSLFGCHFEKDDIIVRNNGLYGIDAFVWWIYDKTRLYIDVAEITSEKLLKEFTQTCKNADRAYRLIRSLRKNHYVYFYINDNLLSVEIRETSDYEGYLYPRIRELLHAYKNYLDGLLNEVISDCKSDIDYFCNESDFVDEVFSNYLFDNQTLKIKHKQ